MLDGYGNRNGQPQSHGDSPAFPVSIPGSGDNGWHGMSLRDWFAGHALQAIVSKGHAPSLDVAASAYKYADAMLTARVSHMDDQRGVKP